MIVCYNACAMSSGSATKALVCSLSNTKNILSHKFASLAQVGMGRVAAMPKTNQFEERQLNKFQ
jgi:hypothetical protein